MAARIVDMTGKVYGCLTAIRIQGPSRSRGMLWLFRCSCAAPVIADGNEVRRGGITRCPQCAAEMKRITKKSHGLTNTAEYRIWCAMKARCLNHNTIAFNNYGGRGITVCDRWANSFEAFLEDMGKRPSADYTIERLKVDGNYEKSNCCWATRLEQANNKRTNRQIQIDGITRTLAQWSAIAGISESGMRARLKRGVSGSQLLAPSNYHK